MLKSGQTIADYQIVKPLTENKLFEVYQVTGPKVESARLLLIAQGQLSDKKVRQAFVEQSKILLGQSFPGLCTLLVAEVGEEHNYCLYPFPQGRSLADQLEEGFSTRRSLEIVRELASCLGMPHASGLWHGAISPDVIFLDAGAVVLDQFALGCLLRLDFHSGVDPCYSSPELVRGEPLGTAADLYSLGIVLYRLLTGTVPFRQDDPFATAMQHVQEKAAPLSEALSLLQPLMDGLLHSDPDERFSAEQVVEKIDFYLKIPEIDSLKSVTEDEAKASEELVVESSEPSFAEKLMNKSEMAARIEERLKDRAEILQASSELSIDTKRASTARMTAIGKQNYRKTEDMNHTRIQPKSGSGRFALLIALGIAIGAVLYLVLFGLQTPSQQKDPGFPERLLAGLELGSRQLEQGNIADAEKTFQGLVDEFTLYPQPYNNLAAISAQRGDLEGARSYLERAMATDESYVTVYRNLGTVYSEMARDSYGRALQLKKGQQALTLQVFGGEQLLAVDSNVTEPPQPAKVVTVDAVKTEAEQHTVVVASVDGVGGSEKVEKTETIKKSSAQETAAHETATETTEPVTEIVLTPEPQSAVDFLRRWATAWSAQDVDSYLEFYAREFEPSSGNSRDEWANQRRSRLTRPKSIDVTLDDFSMVRQADERMQIEVTQSYKSDRYADRTRKLFDLTHDGDDWQIVRERSLGRVR